MTGDGTGVVAHAGSAAVRMLADRTGLTGALSAAVARRGFVPGHDRGRVLVDVATMIAAGGQAIADIGLPHDFRTRVRGFSGCFLGVVVEVEDLLRGVVPQP